MVEKIINVFELEEAPNDKLYWRKMSTEDLNKLKRLREERYIHFTTNKEFDKEYFEFIELLTKNEVSYLLIGGYAVAYYGRRQYIGDIDFWINPTKKNNTNLTKTLLEYGYEKRNIPNIDVNKRVVVQLGAPTLRIDLLIGLNHQDFDSCFARRTDLYSNGILLSVISLDDLKESKKLGARVKDIIDLTRI
jgi:hypothetical protein